jgi:hypothetical protein
MSRLRRTSDQPLSLFSFQDIITSVTGVMVLLTLLMALELIDRVVASPTQQTIVLTESSGQSLAEMQAEMDHLRQQLESSNLIAADLPSFDTTKLQQEREQFEIDSKRMQRDLIELSENVMRKLQQLAEVENKSSAALDSETKELERLEKRNAAMREALKSISSSNRIFFNKDKDGKATWIVELTGSQVAAAEIGVSAKPKQFDSEQDFENWLDSLSPPSTAFYLIIKPDGAARFEFYKESIRSRGFDVGFHVVAADQQVIDPTTGAATP